MKRLSILILLCVLQYCYSQTFIPDLVEKVNQRRIDSTREAASTGVYTPNGLSNLLSTLSNINITSNVQNGVSASAQFSVPLRNWWQINVKIDQALGKGDSVATPFNLDGLPPGSKFNIGIQKMIWNPEETKYPPQNIIDSIHKEMAAKGLDSTSAMWNSIIDSLSPGLKKEILDNSYFAPIEPWFLNFRVSLSNNSFNYAIDSSTLNKLSENKFSTSINVSVGKSIQNTPCSQQYISINYAYSNSYKSVGKSTFIKPFGNTGNYSSVDLAFGKPTLIVDHKINVEYDAKMAPNDTAQFVLGLAPNVTYSINQHLLSFQLPLYLFQSKGKSKSPQDLNGGIRIGYLTPFNISSIDWNKIASFKDGFALELFVGVPFKVFD